MVLVLNKGLSLKPSADYHDFQSMKAQVVSGQVIAVDNNNYKIVGQKNTAKNHFVKLEKNGINTWWNLTTNKNQETVLEEALSTTKSADGNKLYNGKAKADKAFYQVGHMAEIVDNGKKVEKTGPVGPFKFLSIFTKSKVTRFTKAIFVDGKNKVTVWRQTITSGSEVMRPGLKFKVDKGSTVMSKLNFVSLMLALFFGTAALPHILIRYYTVPSAKCARKSTIVAISAIGFFYILTLFLGLGAMAGGVLDLGSSNMAAPLLAKSFGLILFAIISAIAFATVLGTVSGLIVAASGAIAHDLMDSLFKIKMTDAQKVKAGKISAIVVGIIAIILGILFKGMNVSYLVGWAFAVAASANLPAILMLLFWKKTTSRGIAASIVVGMTSALTIILLSPSMFERYGFDPATAPIALDNPGIISIPLSFLTLIIISWLTPHKRAKETLRV